MTDPAVPDHVPGTDRGPDPALDAAATPHDDPAPTQASAPAPPPRPRPMIERIGMAFIALVLAALFAVVAVAAFVGGEPFLGVMGAIGCLMVLWVGGLTLFKGR
ncbi:MAG TPA: hypothetical protein VES19_04130 [Candidatus Limnocylindrales bacterium]|nr:hypothetical protein [Candidatus Limnocylindrales bacterium]